MGIGIAGMGHAAPERIMTNHDLSKIVETSDEWIVTRTGIRERRIADAGQGTSQWAHAAAVKALERANLRGEDIDLIVMGTTTPDLPLPSCACLVQAMLGATKATCFDVSAACSGFIYALVTAQQFLQAGTYKNALVIGADQISSYLDWSDRSTCVLFGDGAGACVLRKVEGRGIISSDIGSDGRFAELICIPGGGSKSRLTSEALKEGRQHLKMNGGEVFKHAVRGMAQSIETVLQKAGKTMKDVHWIVPHQANMRIITAVAERLECDKEKIYINLDRYGNTSAASVIMALSEAVENGTIKKGQLALLTTFGAGLVWGSALVEI